MSENIFFFTFYWLIFLSFVLFRAAPSAHGGSQARGPIKVTAAGLHHSNSNAQYEWVWDLHHSSQQHQIINPLSEARDLTRNLMDASRIRLPCAMTGAPLFLYLFCFLELHPWHMEVPRLGVKSKLKVPAYTTATAAQDPSRIWDLHHSSWQCQILSPLSEARDRTHNLMVLSQIRFCCATKETPKNVLIF